MHLTNIMSAMDSKTIKTELQPATRNQNWRLLPQVSNQTLSPPEGILETKVQNPQEMCRTEMTRLIVSRDRFDPGVGTWVWMTPSPWETSPEESSTRLWKHPRSTSQIEARNPPSQKSKLEGTETPSLIWPPWCQFSWPNCWPRKGEGKRRSVNLQTKRLQQPWFAPSVELEEVQSIKFQLVVLKVLIRKISGKFSWSVPFVRSEEVQTNQVFKWFVLTTLTRS